MMALHPSFGEWKQAVHFRGLLSNKLKDTNHRLWPLQLQAYMCVFTYTDTCALTGYINTHNIHAHMCTHICTYTHLQLYMNLERRLILKGLATHLSDLDPMHRIFMLSSGVCLFLWLLCRSGF